MTDDDTLERVAIAGATAIQHIIAERNDLRNRTHVQQQELVVLRAINEELRGRIAWSTISTLRLPRKSSLNLRSLIGLPVLRCWTKTTPLSCRRIMPILLRSPTASNLVAQRQPMKH